MASNAPSPSVRASGLAAPLWLVAAWSAAEAVLFFVVVDVPIGWIAIRRGTRAALLAAGVAALAAVVGALLVWWWWRYDPSGMTRAVVALPAIDASLVAEATARFGEGPQAVLVGSFVGIPFKLFALAAAQQGQWSFVLLAPLLRLPRFLLMAAAVGAATKLLARWMTPRAQLLLLTACWVAFYGWYWA